MVLISKKQKREIYEYLIREGVLVVKKVGGGACICLGSLPVEAPEHRKRAEPWRDDARSQP